MEEIVKWAILRGTDGGLELKPLEKSEGKEIVEEFETFSEAKTAFNFYCYILLPKFGQNMNF